MSFERTDTSTLGRWWWTVDRLSLAALILLVGIGMVMTFSASPAVAVRIGAGPYHFVKRQVAFGLPAMLVMAGVSLLTPIQVRRLSVIGMLGAMAMMVVVLIIGPDVKGAARWITLGGLSIQPSEFFKPTFAVVVAWMFSEARLQPGFPGRQIAIGLFAVAAMLLLAEPDVGQTIIISGVWGIEFFLAGLPLIMVGGLLLLGAAGSVAAYFVFHHVQVRVAHFLDPKAGGAFQVITALKAIHHGGLFGVGPGEGRLKLILPDAHTDFILAVAGEEFGVLVCLAVIALFAFVVLRGLSRLNRENNLFIVLAASGLFAQFGLEAAVNMATTLRLMPAKGMTLPFISYGGSSLLGMALGMGMALALTRKRYPADEEVES
jgi:cell division protein FtsW